MCPYAGSLPRRHFGLTGPSRIHVRETVSSCANKWPIFGSQISTPMQSASSPISQPARGPITFGIILAAVMSALDTTVVNVALPHMEGSLSASPEQITWVLTSYIVAVAVMTPLSGWLITRFGIKPTMLVCVAGFTIASALCGAAVTLPQIVLFRMLQGALAAPLMPAAQVVLFNINPPERHGRAMAMFTMASVVAPVVGPVVGGYLTEDLSWRWCFYINVPAGIGALAILSTYMPHEPVHPRRFDFLGFGSLALAVSALQLMLDRGTSQDWFGSNEIRIEAAVAGTAFCFYLAHTFTTEHPLFPPALFRDRNLVASAIFNFFFMALMFSSLMLLPLMMQGLLGYSVIHSGVLSMPRGLVMLAILPFMGRLEGKVNRQLLVAVGMGFIVLAFLQMTKFDTSMTGKQIVVATALQGVGQGILFVPLATLAFATVSRGLRADASALSNLLRNLGGSIGVAAIQAVTASNIQTVHASLATHITTSMPIRMPVMPDMLSSGGVAAMNAEITRQATMVAYIDDFWLMSVLSVICLGLVFLLRQQPSRATDGGMPLIEVGH